MSIFKPLGMAEYSHLESCATFTLAGFTVFVIGDLECRALVLRVRTSHYSKNEPNIRDRFYQRYWRTQLTTSSNCLLDSPVFFRRTKPPRVSNLHYRTPKRTLNKEMDSRLAKAGCKIRRSAQLSKNHDHGGN